MFTGKISDRLKTRAEQIRLIAFDVDGVMTDGSLFIGTDGELVKRFFALDGLGVKLAQQFSLEVAIISARKSEQTITRFKDLGVSDIYTGCENKIKCLEELCQKYSLGLEQVAYIGDDSIDVPILEKVGLAACPPDSHFSVFKHIHYITERAGGHGAARELIDLILWAQGKIPA